MRVLKHHDPLDCSKRADDAFDYAYAGAQTASSMWSLSKKILTDKLNRRNVSLFGSKRLVSTRKLLLTNPVLKMLSTSQKHVSTGLISQGWLIGSVSNRER